MWNRIPRVVAKLLPRRFGLSALFFVVALAAVGFAVWQHVSRPHGPRLVGTVHDHEGRPVAGCTITLWGGMATRWKVAETVTDEAGNYLFWPVEGSRSWRESSGSEPGRASIFAGVTVEHPHLVTRDHRSWRDIEVPDVRDYRYVLDFSMEPGGFIRGQVIDATSGSPLEKVHVRLSMPMPDAAEFTEYTFTDAEGFFQSAALAPGRYTIDVNDPRRRYPLLGNVQVAPGETAEVTLTYDRSRTPPERRALRH